jgi:ABC-type transport system involved in cytochrome bd biosynthesis fused ATPase/permease subunit
MEAIQHLAGTKTILIIAHRMTTLRNCDVLHVLRGGRLVESSTYEGVATPVLAPVTSVGRRDEWVAAN